MIDLEKVEYISKEEAEKFKMFRGRTGWRLKLLEEFMNSNEKAFKLHVPDTNMSFSAMRKKVKDEVDFFSRTIEGKKYIFGIKKG